MTYCIHMHVLCLYHIYNLDIMAKPDGTNSWLGIYLIYHLHKPGTDEELVSRNFRRCRNSEEPSMDKLQRALFAGVNILLHTVCSNGVTIPLDGPCPMALPAWPSPFPPVIQEGHGKPVGQLGKCKPVHLRNSAVTVWTRGGNRGIGVLYA